MKNYVYLLFFLLFIFSCQENELNVKEKSSFSHTSRLVNFQASNSCGIEFQVYHHAFYNVNNEPSVILNWEGSSFDLDCMEAADQYIQISNTINGGCGYQNIDEFYSIDFFNNDNYLINNINYLTDSPYYVYYSGGYNIIYGSKCFYWRIALFNTFCHGNKNEICEKEVYSPWIYFEFDI